MALKAVPKKKKQKVKKVTVTKVQEIFNAAIKRRDNSCVTCGRIEYLQASHFFGKGGSGSIRYHPQNVHTQCSKCHIEWHNNTCMPYLRYMENNVPKFELVEQMKKKTIKYNQEILSKIVELSKQDDLDGVEKLIEERMIDK